MLPQFVASESFCTCSALCLGESLQGFVQGIPSSCQLPTYMNFLSFSNFDKAKRDKLYLLLGVLGASLFDILTPIMQDKNHILHSSSSLRVVSSSQLEKRGRVWRKKKNNQRILSCLKQAPNKCNFLYFLLIQCRLVYYHKLVVVYPYLYWLNKEVKGDEEGEVQEVLVTRVLFFPYLYLCIKLQIC